MTKVGRDSPDNTQIPDPGRLPGSPEHEVSYLIVLTGAGAGGVFRIDRDLIIGRDEHADIRVLDDWASRRHARIRADDPEVTVEDLGSTNGTLVNGQKVAERQGLRDGDRISVGSTSVLKFTYRAGIDEEFKEAAYDRASRDALTGVHSRKFFDETLRGELAYARRHARPLAVLLVDADGFEKMNAKWGRLAGDGLLIALARRLETCVRADDVLARYGGDEFVILRRSVSQDQAFSFARRINALVADDSMPIPGRPDLVDLTVSIGLAHFPAAGIGDAAQLLAVAEHALGSAKRTGGNRVRTQAGR